MIIAIETKILIKFETSKMMYVELTTKTLPNVSKHEKLAHPPTYRTPQPCCQSVKLRIMTTGVETKILIKFEASKMCVELTTKTLLNVYTFPNL